MTIRPIRYLGDPVLRRPAKAVQRVDDSIRRLIEDMTESMYAAQGVGLAAPQIGVGLQVLVIGIPEQESFALVNPRLIQQSGSRLMETEGCLSVPGYRGALQRSREVAVEGLDQWGETVVVRATDDLLAEALEHEVDHLNGILYVDHLESIDTLQKLTGGGWQAEAEDDSEEAAEEQKR